MKATLTIQMDNAAFGDFPEYELQRIFEKLARVMRDSGGFPDGFVYPVMDFNGLKVGSLTIEED